ncbi:MAG: archaeoflavoprotein AfpA [Candidatus Helarchaeota archaeon]|nr:archaeoflavoprotein AfpA [Candidatus Helarchaeota archaeon]
MALKICWGITGAGDYLLETFNVMKEVKQKFNAKITVIISEQGVFVLKWYKMLDDIKTEFEDVRIEKGPNIPFIVGPLQTGAYKFFFVSPLSGNSTAKAAYGIADSLITNAIAQTMKGGIPVYVYPVDQKAGEFTTILPDGKKLNLKSRKLDLEIVEKLRKMEGIFILSHPNEIIKVVEELI